MVDIMFLLIFSMWSLNTCAKKKSDKTLISDRMPRAELKVPNSNQNRILKILYEPEMVVQEQMPITAEPIPATNQPSEDQRSVPQITDQVTDQRTTPANEGTLPSPGFAQKSAEESPAFILPDLTNKQSLNTMKSMETDLASLQENIKPFGSKFGGNVIAGSKETNQAIAVKSGVESVAFASKGVENVISGSRENEKLSNEKVSAESTENQSDDTDETCETQTVEEVKGSTNSKEIPLDKTPLSGCSPRLQEDSDGMEMGRTQTSQDESSGLKKVRQSRTTSSVQRLRLSNEHPDSVELNRTQKSPKKSRKNIEVLRTPPTVQSFRISKNNLHCTDLSNTQRSANHEGTYW
ncbi:hypothetical protein RB195_016188 [Necator americanus]|uniref:Uncharacterized protein n=1 Tax=Necator americanus TaxID=51031 RepID=A0ABR1E7Y8_NECAM